MLTIRNLKMSLGGRTLFENASLQVNYGDRVALVGPNGAGKSTLFSLILRKQVPDEGVLERVRRLKTGDPLSEDTDLGPLIDGVAASRVQEWLDEAVAAGAVVLAGGARSGWVWEPTVVASLPSTVRMSCQEVFAPVVSIDKYSDIAAAIRSVNASEYGLQAGIFTHDDRVIAAASDDIEVGGLMVNDVSMFRVDHMPYGGVKMSGFGREGVRYAIEEMTERKLVTVNRRR